MFSIYVVLEKFKTNTIPYILLVFSKVCTSCNSLVLYEGEDDGILNMGKFLIGYDVLRDYRCITLCLATGTNYILFHILNCINYLDNLHSDCS